MFFKHNRPSEDGDPAGHGDPVGRKPGSKTGPLPSQEQQAAEPPTQRQDDPIAAPRIEDSQPLRTLRLESQTFSSLLDLTPAPDWSRMSGSFQPVPKDKQPSPENASDWRIELKTPFNEEQPLRLHILGDVVLGRTSLADVELDIFAAADKGVSRRHALLRPTSHQLYLIELGSTNGTLLNGMQLGPGMARPLRSEDIITLGDLRLTVRLYGGPTQRPGISVVDMYVPDVLEQPDRETRAKRDQGDLLTGRME